MNPTREEVREGLLAARAMIATPGQWCREVMSVGYRPGAVRCCILGAPREAGCGLAIIVGVECALAAQLPEWARLEGGKDLDNFNSLARFNDHPDTQHADVLALYDRAIAAQAVADAQAAMDALAGEPTRTTIVYGCAECDHALDTAEDCCPLHPDAEVVTIVDSYTEECHNAPDSGPVFIRHDRYEDPSCQAEADDEATMAGRREIDAMRGEP